MDCYTYSTYVTFYLLLYQAYSFCFLLNQSNPCCPSGICLFLSLSMQPAKYHISDRNSNTMPAVFIPVGLGDNKQQQHSSTFVRSFTAQQRQHVTIIAVQQRQFPHLRPTHRPNTRQDSGSDKFTIPSGWPINYTLSAVESTSTITRRRPTGLIRWGRNDCSKVCWTSNCGPAN